MVLALRGSAWDQLGLTMDHLVIRTGDTTTQLLWGKLHMVAHSKQFDSMYVVEEQFILAIPLVRVFNHTRLNPCASTAVLSPLSPQHTTSSARL